MEKDIHCCHWVWYSDIEASIDLEINIEHETCVGVKHHLTIVIATFSSSILWWPTISVAHHLVAYLDSSFGTFRRVKFKSHSSHRPIRQYMGDPDQSSHLDPYMSCFSGRNITPCATSLTIPPTSCVIEDGNLQGSTLFRQEIVEMLT